VATLFVEHLTVIDASILDATLGLVGESWIVDLELEGELDAQGMVLDFGAVKRELKRGIDQEVDHRLLVPLRAAGLERHADGGLDFDSEVGRISHRAPASAVAPIDAEQIDEAALSTHLQHTLAPRLPGNIRALRLLLRHESPDGARYRYSHGLRQHDGACQRIAHGHRSRLQIEVDGERDAGLEHRFADRWAEIYLADKRDLLAANGQRLRFGYRAPEGDFELSLPADRCDLLPCETTVENLAATLARRAAIERPGAEIRVRAYEGVMKGAIGRAQG
jgi:6-pyruvoyl-tetrahydropterin synthase